FFKIHGNPFRNGVGGPSKRQPSRVFRLKIWGRPILRPRAAAIVNGRRALTIRLSHERARSAVQARRLGRRRAFGFVAGAFRDHRLRLTRGLRLTGLLTVGVELALAIGTVHLGVRRGHGPWRHVLPVAVGLHDPIVVLGMLVEVLGSDAIARGRGLARQRDIALENLIGIAPDFDAGAIAIEGLHPVRRTRTTVVATVVVLTAAHVVGIVIAAPATLVLTWSHDTFEVLMHV